jgi:hypothetical protein
LNEKLISVDNLASLFKVWPGEEIEDLVNEAQANPSANWAKTE